MVSEDILSLNNINIRKIKCFRLMEKLETYCKYTHDVLTDIQLLQLISSLERLNDKFRTIYNYNMFRATDDMLLEYNLEYIGAHLNNVINFITNEQGYVDTGDKNLDDVLTNMIIGRYVGIGPAELFINLILIDADIHGLTGCSDIENATLETSSYDILSNIGKFEVKMLDNSGEIRIGGASLSSNFDISNNILEFLKDIDSIFKIIRDKRDIFEQLEIADDIEDYIKIINELYKFYYSGSKRLNKNVKNISLYEKYKGGEFSANDFNYKLSCVLEIFYELLQNTKDIPYAIIKSPLGNNLTCILKDEINIEDNNINLQVRKKIDNSYISYVELLDDARKKFEKIFNIDRIKKEVESQMNAHLNNIPFIVIKNLPEGNKEIGKDCFVGVIKNIKFKRLTSNKFKFCLHGDKCEK